jgi:ribosomal protein L44E
VVNPGDLMNIDQTSIEERVRTCLGSSSSSDYGDYKPPIQRSMHRRPHSFGDFGALTFNGRIKRTYTKPENANFRCDQCGRAFQRAYNLRSHLANVHNRHRARQHPCEYDGCTNTFVRRTDLTRHEESVCICNLVQQLVSNRL